MNLVGNTVTIDVHMATGWTIVNTGFPGSFGFSDSLAGLVTIGNFSSALYSGGTSDAASDQHFDGFGYFTNAGATTGPNAANGINEVSFDGSGSGLNDVEQLLNLASPAGGDGLAYFVVDAFNGQNTGLLAVTGGGGGGGGGGGNVPEPQTLALIGLGLLSLALARRRIEA